MSKKKRKTDSREFKLEAVRLIAEKGCSIIETSSSLGVEYIVLCRWKKQLVDNPNSAFPSKGQLKATGQELRTLQRE